GERGIRFVAAQRFVVRPDRRKQVFPGEGEYSLHGCALTGHREDQVVLRKNDAELSERAVTAVAVACHPELEAVALLPVGCRIRARRYVRSRCLIDPRGGKELATVPLAFVQVELAELGDGFGVRVHPAEADFMPHAVADPADAVDTEWF